MEKLAALAFVGTSLAVPDTPRRLYAVRPRPVPPFSASMLAAAATARLSKMLKEGVLTEAAVTKIHRELVRDTMEHCARLSEDHVANDECRIAEESDKAFAKSVQIGDDIAAEIRQESEEHRLQT